MNGIDHTTPGSAASPDGHDPTRDLLDPSGPPHDLVPDLHYLRREEIDALKWDACIRNAPNGWLYARSLFLDGIGPWDALVAGDYEWVMPLPKRKKYGITYAYIPPFTGQLGIIGARPVSGEITDRFLSSIPATFRLADLLMNEQNAPPSLPGITLQKRTNYTLSLHEPYDILYDRYTADAKKNLRRTSRLQLSVVEDLPMDTVLDFYRSAYGSKNRHLTKEEYSRMSELGRRCIAEKLGFILGIRNEQGETLAAAFFGKDEKRIYYIVGAPGAEGRKANAVHHLIDEVIRRFAGSRLVFDFEGSDIPSVASFYQKFGPHAATYDLVQLNRLPRWIRWLR